jgi:charged multivesicular body protein 7
MIPLKDFLSSTTSIYHKSWVITPWQIVAWSLRQLGLMGGSSVDKLAVGNFVVTANVEVSVLLALILNFC